MNVDKCLRIGDQSDNGQVTIVDEDRLCYLVKSDSRGSVGLRTISKTLLYEYVIFFFEHPDANPEEARNALKGKSDIDKFEYGYTSTLSVMAQMVLKGAKNVPGFTVVEGKKKNEPRQQIFYGAPGTGKSFKIKENTEVAEKEGRVFRTTFHPDSDYSTFVGAYKPTKVKSKRIKRMNLSLEDLAKELGLYYSNEDLGKIGGIQKFCFDYYPYIDGEFMSVNVPNLLELAGVPKDYNVEINKYIKFCHMLPKQDSDKITYEFVPQAFTNAYVKAWSTEEDVYLIIEEINRGNCAQIFGDLFQLLDRKEGFSEYPIDADTDLANYLAKALAGSSRNDFRDGVKEGKKLVLPKNLYIWATMNTSDQSLFPIDSAFKRRWEWEYIPISESDDDKYIISVGDKRYDWWSFVSKMNKVVENVTSSEDKQLGFYFCKPDEGDNIITAKKFVSKVMFYLCNDVFKNYGFDAVLNGKKVFSYINSEGKNDTMAFTSFFTSNGKPNLKTINQLMKNLDIEEFKSEKESLATEMTPTKTLSVTYKGNVIEGNSAKEVFIKTIEQIVADKGADAVAEIVGTEMTKNPPQNTKRDYKQINNSEWYVASNNGVERFARHLVNLSEGLGIELNVK